MGAEHSQQRAEADGREIFEGDLKISLGNNRQSHSTTPTGSAKRRAGRQSSNSGSTNRGSKHIVETVAVTASPTTSLELSRPPSPPLSVCSDLPYVSYTDRPIGDSPKIRNKPHSRHQQQSNINRNTGIRKSFGATPKRPQSTSGTIVIVKPGARDADYDADADLTRLRNIPQFLPVLRDSITTAAFTRDQEILERLNSQHLVNICCRMQTHLNICATQVAQEQNHLVERTKMVSNSITTLFASFVDMQKTYAAYAEQFSRVRTISQQLSRCNSLLHDNIASLEAINNFLDIEDRLEPFIWRTDDIKQRGEAEGAPGGGSGRLTRM
ncbi:BLOC-1-related complex subunit 5 isoform X1 [Rhagoletis pomonella]|uniref:BLOC-1-related complex subunit 5 isoform X1 n=1 Tax=Rhagoletis pomonella TaxID=28610 RepID=UPI0017810A8A|nr:BLOC-1-related complex subunit 5 isoform X1 [Rhagoletis pomonella]